MKIILEPTAEVVAATKFYGHSRYKIPSDGDDAVRLGAFAGKGCYGFVGGEDGRPNTENQKTIISTKHGSVLEHFNISIYVDGITRACSHEIVRHRAGWGYSQRSTRYTDESDAAIVLEPSYAEAYVRCQPEKYDDGWSTRALKSGQYFGSPAADSDRMICEFLESCERDLQVYASQVEYWTKLNTLNKSGTALRKWARGKARNALPHALETGMTMTGNLRAWRFWIEQRSEGFAEAEIRRLAGVIMPLLLEVAPFYFLDYSEAVIDGLVEYQTEYRKV